MAPAIGLPPASVTRPCTSTASPCGPPWMIEPPFGSVGAASRQNGPRIAEEVASDASAVAVGVSPEAACWSSMSARLSSPSTSLARIASFRLSSDMCPMRTTKSQAAKYSGVVSFTSRAKSCMCRMSAVITSRTRGVAFGPIAPTTVSVNLSKESSATFRSPPKLSAAVNRRAG